MKYTLLFNDLIGYFFVFCRLGGLMMLVPGIGEVYIPVRVRLIAALVLCLAITPLVQDTLPSPALLSNATVFYVVQEITIGVLLGIIGRITLASLQVTASIIGLQSSLSSATAFNPSFGTNDNVIATTLIFAATALVFASDLHYKVFEAFLFSYERFPPIDPLAYNEVAKYSIQLVKNSFNFGVQLAIPFMITGLFINFCLGMLNRLMPQMQVYFIGMPLQILLTLLFLALTIGLMLVFFAQEFSKVYTELL